MNYADRLKFLREKAGLTQKFVAQKIGVKNLVMNQENGNLIMKPLKN
ncbi:hypothetical protein [Bacillus haynesii]|nr:hypothetical protein [Bacillus haynesii]MCY8010346.1 hypothetical protein [Bacillus haynesii]MCY9217340.1 hypothetical protein [Bacillus haynesii]